MERLQREGFEELAARVKREMGMWGRGKLGEGGGAGGSNGDAGMVGMEKEREGTSGVG